MKFIQIFSTTLIFLVSTSFSLNAPEPVSSQEISVCNSGCDFQTVQEAIDNPHTEDGDIILILDAVHTEKGIDITKDLTIQGPEDKQTIIQAHALPNTAGERVFTIPANITVQINNLIIRHGRPDDCPMYGGGVANEGNLTLFNVTIRDNVGSAGGGLMNLDGNTRIINSIIENNTSMGYGAGGRCGGQGGAMMISNGTVQVINSIIRNNTTDKESGGAAYVSCKAVLEVTNSSIIGNQARSLGGAFFVKGKLVLNHSTITQNTTITNGGGIYILGILNAEHSVISENFKGSNVISDCVLGEDHQLELNEANFIGDGSCQAEYSGDPGWSAFDPTDENWQPVPLSGSPLLDIIPDQACDLSEDLRGFSRPAIGESLYACDLGAFELQSEELKSNLVPTRTLWIIAFSQVLLCIGIFMIITRTINNKQ
ncbi:MAG: hypothetical protein JEZ06_11025 [Anaerolineaceae bacterium]|nr:hypothetical protein [Anaerolineaceae bacterium]